MAQHVDAAYIHIPFCKKICHYCAFNKYFYDGQPVDAYLEALEQEMKLYVPESQPTFDTIYVGGGTPSCLSEDELAVLLESIYQVLPYNEKTEYTFEVNPGELSYEKCKLMKSYGVNRISMGVQTFNDTLLRQIGRNHRTHHVYESIEWLRQAGFHNISIDLIFRLPNQTIDDFAMSLEKAMELDLPHYSLYSLLIEQKTVFQQLMREGKLPLPSEDVDADMFELAIQYLGEHQIKQYEVSNFARDGYASRHNLKYWRYEDYYGFGAGAHGFVDNSRYYNHGPVHHYLNKLNQNMKPVIHSSNLTFEDQMEEFVFLGLRAVEGIRQSEFKKRFNVELMSVFGEFMQQQVQLGLVVITGDVVQLTTKGLLLADTVFRELIGFLTK